LNTELHAVSMNFAPLRLNDKAPDFRARSTMGDKTLSDYRGRWLVLFAHPADFTPVCTSEFIAVSQKKAAFDALNCELLGLSIDSLFSHFAWIRDIKENFDVEINFPILEDSSMAIARGYGMLADNATDSSTSRATFVIDPKQIIRAISWYPINVGRSIDELLRLVEALQTADQHAASTPAGWKPKDALLAPAPTDASSIANAKPGKNESWYFRKIKS
jgi:peroxiredoxin 2/4